MSEDLPVVVFTVGNFTIAAPVSRVHYIVRAVAVTPVPDSPPFITGVFNFHGMVIPLIDLRKKFNLPNRPVHPEHFFAIISVERGFIAVLAEDLPAYRELSASSLHSSANVRMESELISSIHYSPEGMIFLPDFDKINASLEMEKISAFMNHFTQAQNEQEQDAAL